MTGIDELDIYIGLMERQLQHPFNTRITLTDGRFNSREEIYIFSIRRSEYKKLEQIRGGYSFEFGRREHPCSIVDLRTNQVRLRIEELREERIEEGTINVDTTNIIKREKWGLQQLKEEQFLDKRRLLFTRRFSGGTQSECIFEENLNEEQRHAVEYAVGVQDVYLIWGPPGTGKTTIVSEIVRNYIRLHENSKILVCSYTNRAVDNVVKKLFNRFSIVRFGDSTLSGDTRYKDALFEEQLKKKRMSIEEEVEREFRRLIRPLEREKAKEEGELNSNRGKKEQIEEQTERIKSEIEDLNAEIEHIKRQISETEHSILKNKLEEALKRIDRESQARREELDNLQTRERTIRDHIRRLNDRIRENEGRLREANENEEKLRRIIYIISRYLEFKRENRISAFWKRRRFEREYKREIHELQLARRSHEELESIREEKLRARERELSRIEELQNGFNSLKQERQEKEEEINILTENRRRLLEDINEKEREQGKLRAKLDLLAHNRLEYNREDLKRENPELHDLYENLSEKQSAKSQKEADLERIRQKHSSLSGIIKRLRNSISRITARIEAKKKEMQREKEESIEKAKISVLKENQIIATTNLRAADKLFDEIEFDLVIMDESGAIDLPGAVIPFLKGKRFILLGDPEQLPPILGERTPEVREFIRGNPAVRQSIFAKFLGNDCRENENKMSMLKSQYRMKREIADFVSSTFYGGQLNTPAEIEIEENLCAYDNDSIISNQYPLVCFPRRFWTDYDSNYSAYSTGEIEFIKNIIEKFKERYGDEIKEHIAIISPYRAQIDRIEEEIPDIECGTVHAFQGQERSIVIFATTKYWRARSNDFGYLLEGEVSRNLLNVAVSRAREKLIIVGSRELFDRVEIYKKLYEHIGRAGYGYVAPRHLSGYDFTTRCDGCGRNIGEFGYNDRYCRECFILHRLRTFLNEMPRDYNAVDTHLLRSSDEVRIDDWFHHNGIQHEVERRVPVSNRLMYCDWYLPQWNIYVEYWGLMNEEWYREARRVKERLYRQAHLDLRCIEPEDMANLDEILRYKFRDILERRH